LGEFLIRALLNEDDSAAIHDLLNREQGCLILEVDRAVSDELEEVNVWCGLSESWKVWGGLKNEKL
jgi:hypothetical protein